MSDRIASIREAYDRCFGCGTANPIGLGLDGFTKSGDSVTVAFSPHEDHNGFAGVLHGGIIAAALDEIMAWTAILVEEVMVVTGTLDIRYRKPADSAESYELVGELVERRGRRLRITGRLVAEGVVIAEASGAFLAVQDLSE